MDVAKSSHHYKLHTQPCTCFKISDLREPILDSTETSDLNNHYVLGDQLGWGQFGIIRTCTDKRSGEVLACKSIAKDRLVTQDDVRSVKLEIEIMSSLSGHPNVVDLKAVYEEEDYVHLVMELCAGGELFHHLEKHGRYSEAEAKDIFRHLMQVVVYCHDNGVVHRDLKPENILLATKSSLSPIKLADFGLATYIKPGQSLHGTVGSPFYIAPEVLAGGYTQAADVWSAGVILYILLSGMPPFWGRTKSRIFDAVRAADLWFPSEHWDRISEYAKELIKGMLCKDPLKRLTAHQVLYHPWIVEEELPTVEEPQDCQTSDCGNLDSSRASCSTRLMNREQDISFGAVSPIICELQSPSLTYRSSFSAFIMEPSTSRSTTSGGIFAFSESHGSINGDLGSLFPSMPSFTFSRPGSMVEQETVAVDFSAEMASSVTVVTAETSPPGGKLVTPAGLSPNPEQQDASDSKLRTNVESKRSGTISSRKSSIHNKRNRTIGLGEFEQLDLMVTESVIRWASCTHLPTCPSFQSSLVC